jgi:CRISPR/Cas system-associated endoribonuclease Cas2
MSYDIEEQADRIKKVEAAGEEFLKEHGDSIYARNLVQSTLDNEIKNFLEACEDLLKECEAIR